MTLLALCLVQPVSVWAQACPECCISGPIEPGNPENNLTLCSPSASELRTVVTTEGTAEMRQQASENGALFVLTKPFTVESFQNALGPIFG